MSDYQPQKNKGFGITKNTEKVKKHNNATKFSESNDTQFKLFNSVVKPLLDIGAFKKVEPTLRLLAQTDTKIAEVYEALYIIAVEEENEKELLYWQNKWFSTTSQSKVSILRQVDEANKLGSQAFIIKFLERIFEIDKNDTENKLKLLDAYLKAENWKKSKNFLLAQFNKPETNLELLWRLAWIGYETQNSGHTQALLREIRSLCKSKKSNLNDHSENIVQSLEIVSSKNAPTQANLEYCNDIMLGVNKEHWPQSRILSIWLYEHHQSTSITYALTDKALKIQPKSYLLLKQKATLHLMMGKWKQGFEEIYNAEKDRQRNNNPNHLNIACNESMGDSLLWSRYIYLLHNLPDKKIDLQIQPPLIPFMQRNLKNIVKIKPKVSNTKEKNNNFGILTLPGMTNWKPELLEKLPLWKADPTEVEKWRIKLNHNGETSLIALNWHGSALKAANENQITDIPLHAMDPTSYIDDRQIKLIGIQKGIGSEELHKCKFTDKFITNQAQVKDMNNLEQLAAVLSLSDWLICDDSGPAHMAGCLGIKTIVCLPEHTDWRWPNNLKSPPWYPKTIMLRKKANEEWDSCLQKAWEIINQWILRN